MKPSRVKGFEERKRMLYEQVLGMQHGLELIWSVAQKSWPTQKTGGGCSWASGTRLTEWGEPVEDRVLYFLWTVN